MSSASRKILVVDDDPAMLRFLTRILEDVNYVVESASDGREALALVREDCPHFVITDWDMPALNGAQLCAALREEDLPHYIYIVMLTGSYTLIEGLCCGADDFVTKPVNACELLARLHAGSRIIELESKLRLLARRDCLTDALNRRTFFDIFEKQWKSAGKSGEPLSCLMMDVDHFKAVNDAYGHLAGDRVLRAVTSVLQTQAGDDDRVCRYGGEEFCVLLPGVGEQKALHCAEACRGGIENLRFPGALADLRVTASFGVAERDKHTTDPEQLIDMADQAMFASKKSSRNRVTAYHRGQEIERALFAV